MFFILSKILLFIFSPLFWVISILLWALLTKKPKRRRNLILTSFILLYLFSNSFLFDEVMRKWETKPPKNFSNQTVYDYAIVLGGVMSYYDNKSKLVGFNRSVDRLMQAIKLYKKGRVRKIVFTGGDATILQSDYREADIIKEYLKDLGLPEEDLIFENQSRNTHENATFVYDLLKPRFSDKILIITSGFHMKRALGCFKKTGIDPDYFVSDLYSGERKFIPDHLLLPDTSTLDRWSTLFHEISGYIIYKIMGYC